MKSIADPEELPDFSVSASRSANRASRSGDRAPRSGNSHVVIPAALAEDGIAPAPFPEVQLHTLHNLRCGLQNQVSLWWSL